MDEFQIEHTGMLSAHDNRISQLERRMNCVESTQTSLTELVTNVAVLAEQIKNIAADTSQIKARLNLLEDRPRQNWYQFLWLVMAALIGFLAKSVLGV